MAEEDDLPPIGTAQNAADVARKAELERAEWEEAFAQIEGDLETLIERLKSTCRQSDWNFTLSYGSGDGLWEAEARSGQPLHYPLPVGFVDHCSVRKAPNAHFAVKALLTYMQINRLA